MKKRVVCCIDDEPFVPAAVKEVVARSKDQGVDYYFLRVGYRDDAPAAIDDPVDLLDEIEKGHDEFGIPVGPDKLKGLSIVGVARTIAQIDKSKADVIFACDLRLENVVYPTDWEDCFEFEGSLNKSKDSIYWDNPSIRAGLFLLNKINQCGFKYVLTSRLAIALESSDMEFWPPLDSYPTDATEEVAKMVERNFKREFGLSRTWLKLATGEVNFLRNLDADLSKQTFRRSEHSLQNVVKSGPKFGPDVINYCRTLLDDLSVIDDDILATQRILKMPAPRSKAMGVAKIIAVMRRSSIVPETYLFDLLDIVIRKNSHQVYLDGEQVTVLSNLEPLIHSDLLLPAGAGLAGLPELFAEAPDTEFSWEHRVSVGETSGTGAQARRRYVYEVRVTPQAPKRRPINLTKLFYGDGNGRRAVDTISRLFSGNALLMVIVRESFDEEIEKLRREGTPKGLYMFAKRTGDDYEIQLYGRLEYNVPAG